MPRPDLPADDLPPQQLALSDRILRQQLDSSLTQRFREQGDRTILQLLATCDWWITTAANVVTLAIVCPDSATNWQVLEKVIPLGNEMVRFSQDAKLRIYSSPEMVDFFEIRVEELSVYQEPS